MYITDAGDEVARLTQLQSQSQPVTVATDQHQSTPTILRTPPVTRKTNVRADTRRRQVTSDSSVSVSVRSVSTASTVLAPTTFVHTATLVGPQQVPGIDEEYPDSPFQPNDRVDSRCRQKGSRGNYSSSSHLGVVMSVLKDGTSRRVMWSYRIEFDEGFEETVELVTKGTGVVNVRSSNVPLPVQDPPPTPPPPTPPPTQSATTRPTSTPPKLPQYTPTLTLHGQHPSWIPVHIHQILFLDEKHLKCKLGMASDYEWIMCVDPENPDDLLPEEDGGVYQPSQPYTKPKYEQECRGVFGVMMTPEEGRRMRPFNYTGLKVYIY